MEAPHLKGFKYFLSVNMNLVRNKAASQSDERMGSAILHFLRKKIQTSDAYPRAQNSLGPHRTGFLVHSAYLQLAGLGELSRQGVGRWPPRTQGQRRTGPGETPVTKISKETPPPRSHGKELISCSCAN